MNKLQMVTVTRRKAITVTESYLLHAEDKTEALMIVVDQDACPEPLTITEEAQSTVEIISMVPMVNG